MKKNIIFEKIAKFTVKRYKLILISALILLALSITSIINFTKIKTNFKDMLRKDNPVLKEFNRISENFKSADNIIVMLEGDKTQMIKFSEYFVKNVKNDRQLKKYIKKIEYKIDRDFYLKNGLLLSKINDLRSMKFMYEQMGFLGFFTGINKSFSNSYSNVNTHHREHATVRFLSSFEIFLETMIKFIDNAKADIKNTAKKLVEAITIGERYYFTPDKKIQMLYILPSVNSDQIDKVTDMVLLLRKKNHPV